MKRPVSVTSVLHSVGLVRLSALGANRSNHNYNRQLILLM